MAEVTHVVQAKDKLLCRACGASYELYPGGKLREIWEVATLTRGFLKQHAACAPPEGSDLRCALCCGVDHDFEGCNAAHGFTKETWLAGYDTGLSSKTLWCFMTGSGYGRLAGRGLCAPGDPADFGRCYRLLLLAPEWRARMPEMASVRGWEKLAPAWEELTALFEEERTRKDGNAPKLYDRIKELSR